MDDSQVGGCGGGGGTWTLNGCIHCKCPGGSLGLKVKNKRTKVTQHGKWYILGGKYLIFSRFDALSYVKSHY